MADDDGDDIARIHAANRRAWPRGQEPIAADATTEDWEVAELVRRGLIRGEGLCVDRGFDDGFEGDVCPYTVRVVETRKKGRNGSGRRRADRVPEPATTVVESEWWYIDDEVCARLLSDEGSKLVDWSEASSFVHVG